MLKTRNLFILKGDAKDVNFVLRNLQFKGLTEILSEKVTTDDILKEFQNNKSVVCCECPEEFKSTAIVINVINSTDPTKVVENCINVMEENIPKHFLTIANSFDCDIGDHKSNSSGLTTAQNTFDCHYCNYILNNGYDQYLSMHRAVYRSTNFIVMPTWGEFIKGYLLIIPILHVMSIAELPSEMKQEFLIVLYDVTKILELTYPVDKFLVWENGTGNGGIGKAKDSVVHSHVHIAPSNLTAEKVINFAGFPFKKISYKQLSLYGNHSYLLIKGSTDDEWWINDNPNLYIPRQYVRQILAEEYGWSGDYWNWRTNKFPNLIESTCRDIRNSLVSNWSSLSERIKQNTKDYLFY